MWWAISTIGIRLRCPCSKTPRASGKPPSGWTRAAFISFAAWDGDWLNDNQADTYYANDYGGHNSVVITDPEPAA